MGKSIRLDQALVDRGLSESRERAKRAILSGQVRVNGHPAAKGSDLVKPGDQVELLGSEKYVSRGGLKLEHALQHFHLSVTGMVAVDLGASTGGFTDCLLQNGAKQVFAVDVGRGQLAWKLRQDPRVVVMEKTNARELTRSHFPPEFVGANLVVADCSFISLRKILPPARELLLPGCRMVALIKPQFEAGKLEVDKGEGVITDPQIHTRVVSELKQFVETDLQMLWQGVTESPLLGPAGNKEFLTLLEKT